MKRFLVGLFLWAFLVGLVTSAYGQGNYWKSKCDQVKGHITLAKDAANNKKIAAFNKLNQANAAAKEAEDAHKGKSVTAEGPWTQAKEDDYQASMKQGNDLLAAGVAHKNAGVWRYDTGTSVLAQADALYAAGDYQGAYAKYTSGSEPVGALEHFNYSANDYDSEYQCNNAAMTWFLYAKMLCQ